MNTLHLARFVALAASVSTCLGAARSEAAPAAATPSPLSALELPIQKARLDNGLRVVMNVDRSTPNVAICVTYDVGSRNEDVGRSGFAHLFEHMMFQGSRNVERGAHFTLITARGGTLNGTTSKDRTNYFEVLPSNELALGLFLEADRMRWLSVTPENLENQRAVVQEEYRMRVSNRAYATGYTKLNELVFEGYFPYAHDTIGSMADLDSAKFEWVKAFHDRYYAPNNAVLTLVGDFDPDEAMSLVRKYFDGAQRKPDVPPVPAAAIPAQSAERTAEVVDTNARTPGVYYGFAIPPFRTQEHFALEMAAVVLGDGESSRLYQRLVRKEGKAREVAVWTNDQRGPDLFAIHAQLADGATLQHVHRAVDEELAKLAKAGPTEAELEKARNRVIASFVFGVESNLQRATRLGTYEVFHGDARLLSRDAAAYLAVKRDEVRDAVRKYLEKSRRSTVTVVPRVTENRGPRALPGNPEPGEGRAEKGQP